MNLSSFGRSVEWRGTGGRWGVHLGRHERLSHHLMRARCVVARMGRHHLLNLLVLVVVLGLVRTVIHVAVLGAVLVLPLMTMLLLLPLLVLLLLLVVLLLLVLLLLMLLLLLLLLPPQMLGLERLSPPQLLLCGHATRLAHVLVSAPLGLLDLHVPLLLQAVVTAPPRLFALVLQRGDLSVERRHAAAAAAAAAAVAVARAVETRLGVHHDEPGAHARYLGRRHTGLLVLQRLGVELVLERAPERVGPVEGGAPFLGAGAAVLD